MQSLKPWAILAVSIQTLANLALLYASVRFVVYMDNTVKNREVWQKQQRIQEDHHCEIMQALQPGYLCEIPDYLLQVG